MRAVALLSMLSLALAAPAAMADPVLRVMQDVRTIQTNGQADVYVVPDKFSITFSVKTFDKVLTNAYAINDKSVKAVVALGARFKIAPEKVQTSEISIEPSYDHSKYDSTPGGKPIGYYVNKSIAFEFSDPKTIAPLITAAIDAGANSLSGVTFSTSQLRKHRDDARVQALRAAREKAAMLATEAGATLGEPIQIVEETFGGGMPQFSNVAQRSMGGGGGTESGDGIALGQVKISASVQTTYELKTNK